MTKSKLKAIDPKEAQPSKPKILVYGRPGVGKTWTALDFPGVYYIDTEGGADLAHYTDKLKKSGGVYFGIDQGSLSFESIIEQVQALATEDHKYKTLVIDSISKIFNYEVTKEAERLGDKNGFGADKKPAVAQMRRLVNWLLRLDMNVILIAHEKPLWGTNKNGDREEMGVTFDCWDKLEYELHLALNIIKVGESRKARVKKTRLTGFPDSSLFDWSYAEFANRYGKDVIESATTKIEIATPEQLKEINVLLELVKLPEDWMGKALSKANADSLAELDKEKAASIISFLKNKLSTLNGE